MTDAITHAPRRPTWLAEVRQLLLFALAVFSFYGLVAQPFYIPSESMMPGLLTGDRLVVSKYPYGWSYASPSFGILPFLPGRVFGRVPERGDVVILAPPGAERRGEILIKRVIGLPGDTVQMVRGRLWIDGKPVATRDDGWQPIVADANTPCVGELRGGTCRVHMLRETLPGGASYRTIDSGPSRLDDTPAYTVPAGRVFVMGDNRDNSADSRVPRAEGGLGGAIPVESIGGRAEFLTFSMNGTATWNPLSWFTALRGGRAGRSLRPERSQ